MELPKNQCPTCHKQFKKQWELTRHLNKKIKCRSPVIENIDDIEEKIREIDNELSEQKKKIEQLQNNYTDYECIYCNKNLTSLQHLKKHQKICKAKIDNITIYEKELGIKCKTADNLTCPYCLIKYKHQSTFSKHKFKSCVEKVKYEAKLKDRVLENRRQAIAQNITNNTNCNNHQIVINMPAMRAFGDENKDYLTTKMLLKELDDCKKINDVTSIVDKFTKLIHANPAHPENHNVLFNSLVRVLVYIIRSLEFNYHFARVFNGVASLSRCCGAR